MARRVNDELADTISNNTLRFGGFAALAMQNATEAAQELKRAVQELGFFGALVNDYQETNADGNSEWTFQPQIVAAAFANGDKCQISDLIVL